MPDIKYVVGSVWGNKEIVSSAGHNKWGQPVYTWKCLKCKKEYGPATGTQIAKYPYSKCCPRRLDEKSNYLGYKEITGSKLTQMKDGARRRNLEFSVSPEYLWKVFEDQGGLCAYSGVPLVHGVNASLDRIDSSVGYVEGNVQWTSWIVNRMKLNISHEEFIQLCSLIASRNGEHNGNNNLDTQGSSAPISP